MAAYMGLLSNAQNVSQTPYQAYTGPEVAPINAQQLYGLNVGQQGAAGFLPYAGQAGQYISGAGKAVTGADINQYMDPYTQQVINATQADFDVQNKRAQSAVTGNAAAQGALGGNRVGVAQALTQEGQERVQAPVLAQLRSQGFQSAEEMANAQKQRELQAGMGLSAADIAQAQQQFGFGTAEQATTQAGYTQAMTDYWQKQGYPFAVASWLAGITLPTGAQMGQTTQGVSTTQGPQPNQFLQAAGLGLSAASIFSDRRMKENLKEVGRLHDGQKIYRFNYKGDPTVHVGLIADEVAKDHPKAVKKIAGFGAVDYDEATKDAIKKWSGGAIHGFADGGSPFGSGGPFSASGQGWVPTQGNLRGTPLQPANLGLGPRNMSAQQLPADMGKNLGTAGKSLYDKFGSSFNLSQLSEPSLIGSGEYVGPEGYSPYADAQGGRVPRRNGGRAGFAYGGVPISSGFAGGGYSDDPVLDLSNEPPIDFSGTYNRGDDYNALRLAGNESPMTAANVPFSAPSGEPFDRIPVGGGVGGVEPTALRNPAATEALAYGPRVGGRSNIIIGPRGNLIGPADRGPVPVAGVASPGVQPGQTMGGFNPLNLSDAARQGLISMGLGMMSNRVGGRGSFLAGLGEGGEQGMGTYASAMAATAGQQLAQQKMQQQRDLEEMKLKQAMALKQTMTPFEAAHLAIMQKPKVVITTDEMGRPRAILEDPMAGTAKDIPIGPALNAEKSGDPNVERRPYTPSPTVPTEQQAQYKPFTTKDLEGDEGALPPGARVIQATDFRSKSARPDVLESIRNQYGEGFANSVQAIAEGQIPMPPQGRAKGQNILLREKVMEYDPDYSAQRYKLRTDYLGRGMAGKSIESVDMIMQHANSYLTAVDKLGNLQNLNILNPAINLARGQYSHDFRDAKAQLEKDGQALATELMKVTRTTGIGSETEIRDWRQGLDPNAAADSQRQSARAALDLLEGRLQGMANLWNKTFGSSKDPMSWMSQNARENFDKYINMDTRRGLEQFNQPSAAPATEKHIVQTGKVNSGPNAGKTAIKYSDGTIEYK